MENQLCKTQIPIEDLCEEEIHQNVLRSLKDIEFDVGMSLKQGKIKLRASADVPAKLLMSVFALGMLGMGAVNNKVLILKILSYL